MLVAANWKCNGSFADLEAYASAIQPAAGVEAIVFPPAVYVAWLRRRLPDSVAVGVQDVSLYAGGAHTGEISVSIAADVGASWVLVGHSERREDQQEDDAIVAAKLRAVVDAGLRPILCVGESEASRQSDSADVFVAAQVTSAIEAVGADQLATGAIAYEPIWAIGSGVSASPSQAAQMHAVIRSTATTAGGLNGSNLQVIYGGSVKQDNAASLFAEIEIGGALVGGASMQAESFNAIVDAAAEARR